MNTETIRMKQVLPIPFTLESPLSENKFILYLFIFYLLRGEDG